MTVSLRTANGFDLHVTVDWGPPKMIEAGTADTVKFRDVPDGPGVYRIICKMAGRPKRVYVGEAMDFGKRFRYYERPLRIVEGATSANRGLHRRLRNVLRHGGSAQYQAAGRNAARVSVGSRSMRLDMDEHFHRRLAEDAAIVNDQRLGYQVINADTNRVFKPRRPRPQS